MTCRSLCLALLLLCDVLFCTGNSWDCRLASEGSVRGVDLEAALHSSWGIPVLDREVFLPLPPSNLGGRGGGRGVSTLATLCTFATHARPVDSSINERSSGLQLAWVLLQRHSAGTSKSAESSCIALATVRGLTWQTPVEGSSRFPEALPLRCWPVSFPARQKARIQEFPIGGLPSRFLIKQHGGKGLQAGK